MSTILKALHRLEREKSAELERPLRQEVTSEPQRARRSLGWVPFAALAAGIAAAAPLIWLWPEAVGRLAALASGTPAPASEVVILEAAPAAASAAPFPAPAPAVRAVPPPPAAEVAAVPRSKRSASQSKRRSTRRRAQSAADPAPVERTLSVAALASPVELVKPTPKALPPSDIVVLPERRAPVRPAAAVAASSPRPDSPRPSDEAPTIAQARAESPAGARVAAVPQHRVDTTPRAPLPVIRVQRTEWHPQTDRRVAVIEIAGRPEPLRLREGDAVGLLVVVTIEPSGVVFDHDGVSFRRRIGPSL